MATRIEIKGKDKLLKQLQTKLEASKKQSATVLVGYTQSYALYVHENLEAYHPVGQAKFLEQPAREMKPVLVQIINAAVSKGVSVPQAILMAGLRLQAESQLLCPVDTGALRASAFTRFA